MKFREFKYKILSYLLWGSKKQYYKCKWKAVKLERKQKKRGGLSQDKITILVNKLRAKTKETGKPVVVYFSYFDYYSPLQQRPNHMFNLLADKGYPCLFCSTKYSEPRENLFVIPSISLKDVLACDFPRVFDIPYGFPYRDIDDVFHYLDNNTLVLYELIDDFDLLGDESIVRQAKELFSKLVRRENTFVFTSADKLYQIALSLGAVPEKTIMSKNAVNIHDFQKKDIKTPEVMQKVLQKGKPVIGYYGALTATWFDFDLLLGAVEKNPDMEFVLMGWKYPDKNTKKTNEYFSKLENFDNFTYIPPVPYADIPYYARCWSVAIIPFQINDITLGTSPVKLFEYMAMGLPIVTTPMPECKLYKSVYIAEDIAQFSQKLKEAVAAKDDEKYQKILQKEAFENTWEMRVNDMINIIEEHSSRENFRRKNKVLIVSANFSGGGLEKRINNIVNRFHNDYAFTLITKTPPQDMRVCPSKFIEHVYKWEEHEKALAGVDIIDVHPFGVENLINEWHVLPEVKKIYTLHGEASLDEKLGFLEAYDRIYSVSKFLIPLLEKGYPQLRGKILLSKNRDIIKDYNNDNNILFSITNTNVQQYIQKIINHIPPKYTIHMIGMFPEGSFVRPTGKIIFHGFVNIDALFEKYHFNMAFARGGFASMDIIARNIPCFCISSNMHGLYFELLSRKNFLELSDCNFVTRKKFKSKNISAGIKLIEKVPEDYQCHDLLEQYNNIELMSDIYF